MKRKKQASVRQLIAQLGTRVTALEASLVAIRKSMLIAIQASPTPEATPTPEPEASAEEQPKKHWYSCLKR